MPLYNGNVNIIEGGNSLLQLYNYPPVIEFTTTGSNRVVFNIKQNVFCGGMELQWCKSNLFASGTVTSSNIDCTASVLEPLTSYRGFTQTMGNFGSASLSDDGIYYMRVRGTNKVQFYPYLPTSSFSEPLEFSINRLASGSCYYVDGTANYITEVGGETGAGTWLPSGFDSSSQKWYSSAVTSVVSGPITSNLSGSLTFISGTIHKFGDERGAELNNEVIRFSNPRDPITQTPPWSSIYFDQSSSTTPNGVSFMMTTGSFRIGTSDNVDGAGSTPWVDVVGNKMLSNGGEGPLNPPFTLPISTASFDNLHVYLCTDGGGVRVFLNGSLAGSMPSNTPPSGRYLVFQLYSDSEFKFIGTRQDAVSVATVPSIQSASLNCAFTS